MASFELCAPAVKPFMPRDGSDTRLSQLWEEPRDLESRDVFNGPWGRKHAPDPKAVYTFVHSRVHGASPGMTVTDPEGRKWSINILGRRALPTGRFTALGATMDLHHGLL